MASFNRQPLLCKQCSKDASNLNYSRVLAATLKQNDNFECPECFMLSLDPLNQVVRVLHPMSMMITEKQFQIRIEEEKRKVLASDSSLYIQIRAMKMDSKVRYMVKFPDKYDYLTRCTILLNGKSIRTFTHLDPNISTKMRKDEKVDIDDKDVLKSERFTLTFKFENIFDEMNKNSVKGDNPIHLFSVFIVKKLPAKQLLKTITTQNKVEEASSKEFIRQVFSEQSVDPNLAVPEIKITNKCPVTMMPIKYPGRGQHCQHLQPFCLESFMAVMESSYPRSWMCTICKLPCHRLSYDEYLKNAMIELDSGDNDSVYFHPDGTYAYQGNLVFKAKQTVNAIIEEEHAIQVQDMVGIEDELTSMPSIAILLEPFQPSTELNPDSLIFFRNLYRQSTTKEALGDLCQRLMIELKIDPVQLIEEVKQFNL